MLSSKANAALARLKEIENKYKIKREEQKWNSKEDIDSSISSVSIISSENFSTRSPRNVLKLKLDIKIPEMRFEGCAEETKLSSESKKSMPNGMSLEHQEDVGKTDLDVTMPSKDKSPRSTEKQESFISDVTSIQENSSIESVLDDSMISSKSLSRSKTSRGNSSLVSNKSSKREERTKAAAKHEKEKESSEISRRKTSSDNSSITKRLRLFDKSNEKTFNVRSSSRSRKRSIEEKVIKIPNATDFDRNLDRSRSLRDDSLIEESISTAIDDGSEIISEFSHAKINITAKIDNSIGNSQYIVVENASVIVPSISRQMATESGYANDTFEDISSSTMQSQSQREQISDEKKKINSARFSAKKIETPSLEQNYQNNKSNRNGQVIELVVLKPNATEINLEPSNYTNDFESNANSNNIIVRLIKSPKIASSRSEKRYQDYRPDSCETKVSNATNFDENISNSSKSLTGVNGVTSTNEKKNSLEIKTTSVRQDSVRKEHGKASNKIKQRTMINIAGPPVADERDINKLSLSEKNKIEKENIFQGSLNQCISQDAAEALKKLHKDAHDALVKRYTKKKVSKESSESKTKFEIKDAMKTRKEIPREENESPCSSEESKTYDHNDRKLSGQEKKKSVKLANSKLAQVCITEKRKEDKASKFDAKHTHGLRKRMVELRLQQEREDLQKYLQELKNSKLESGSTQGYFSPLEFPKIAEFTALDPIDSESKLDDQHIVLRERVSAIKRYLKDQYILYRDYCTIAQAINAHYVPTTLQDAKKIGRRLRTLYNKDNGDAIRNRIRKRMDNRKFTDYIEEILTRTNS